MDSAGSVTQSYYLQLCESAQYWANILAQRDEYFHQNLSDVGENLFLWPVTVVPKATPSKERPEITGSDVAYYWYKTMRNYYFFKNPTVLHAHAGTMEDWRRTRETYVHFEFYYSSILPNGLGVELAVRLR